MKIIYGILLLILLLLLGNWYYAAQMPAVEEVIRPVEQSNGETELISAVDPKSGIEFQYPKNLPAEYISTPEWPPRFVNSFDPIKCDLDEQNQAMSGATSRTITANGNTYCLWETREGAAGSTYITYQVIYPKEDQYFTMSFTLQYPQCMNYPEEEASVCEREQDEFPINNLIDSMAQSAKL